MNATCSENQPAAGAITAPSRSLLPCQSAPSSLEVGGDGVVFFLCACNWESSEAGWTLCSCPFPADVRS